MPTTTKVATGTGNFTSSSSWQTCDATADLDTNSPSTTAIGTSALDSSAFSYASSPPTVDGVALSLAGRATAPSGTFTVTLRDSTASSDVDSVTVNVSDLAASGLGWVFFKFGSSHALTTHSYLIRVVCSNSGSQVTLNRNATANNWLRKLRTTTTGSPAANDTLIISKEFTGAGTSNNVSLTMDNTAATTWGNATPSNNQYGVCVAGNATLTFGTSASTAYVFQWRGIFYVAGGGTVNIGTSGTRMPASSSVQITCDCSSNLDSHLDVDSGGTLNVYGASKTPWTRLTADYSSGTGITVADTTGWQSGDLLVITGTGTSATGDENKSISTVNSGTSVTLSGSLSNAHSGTGLPTAYQAYVLNLNRNVKFNSVSSSLRGYLIIKPSSTSSVHIEHLEMDPTKLGNTSNTQGALTIQSAANCYIGYVSFNPSTLGTVNCWALVLNNQNSPALAGFEIDHCIGYRFGGASPLVMFQSSITDTTWKIHDCVACRTDYSDAQFEIGSTGGKFYNNVAVCISGGGSAAGFRFCEQTNNNFDIFDGTSWYNNEAMLCSGNGLKIGGQIIGTDSGHGCSMYVYNSRFYRCNGGVSAANEIRKLTLDTVDVCGAQSNNAGVCVTAEASNACRVHALLCVNCTFSGDTGVSPGAVTALGTSSNNVSAIERAFLYNCTFGVSSGLRGPFASADLGFANGAACIDRYTFQVWANKCTFATNSTSPFLNLTNAAQQVVGDHVDGYGSFLRCQDYGQAAGDHRTFAPQGNIRLDSTVYHTAAPSAKLTPNSSTYKLRGSAMLAPVSSGTTRTVSAWVRRSQASSGDAADYNGNNPRLVVRRNDAVGISSDTVLATGSAGLGTWEQLSGTILSPSEDGAVEVYVDCDGTAGFVNVDDWAIA